MSIELSFNSTNKHKTNDQKENTVKLRRRQINCLIAKFLENEGLFQTLERFSSEAQMSNEYVVCDNIDLEIVLQDFLNFHYFKYNKYPTLCRKREKAEKDSPKISPSNVNSKRNVKNLNKIKTDDQYDVKNHSVDSGYCNYFSIKQLTNAQQETNPVEVIGDTKIDDLYNTLLENRPISGFLSSIPVEYKPMAESIYRSTKTCNSNVTWKEVIGLENAKMALKEAAIYPTKYPKLFCGLTSPWKGILLFGPPGTGKTLLAKALSNQSNRTFFNVSPSILLSKWRGESEKNVKILFDLARYYSPSIIFMDEVEALVSNRDCPMEHESSRRLKSEILMELDGLGRCSEDILFLATSNLPWDIDPAILRRLEKRIYIPLPDKTSRCNIFETYLKNSDFDIKYVSFAEISDMTDGYSGADIHIICKEAAMTSLRILLATLEKKDCVKNYKKEINQDVLKSAILRIKPSAVQLLEKFKSWAKLMRSE